MFSIVIPTFNNIDYLKLCIKSLKQNSKYNHQIIPHVNIGNDGTIEFLKSENIDFHWCPRRVLGAFWCVKNQLPALHTKRIKKLIQLCCPRTW